VDREIKEAQGRIGALLGMHISALRQWSNKSLVFFTLTHHYSLLRGPLPTKRKKKRNLRLSIKVVIQFSGV